MPFSPSAVPAPTLPSTPPDAARIAPPVDAVQALRAATHAQHAALDQGLPLARANATLADYLQHLTVLRDWQIALSPWLSRVLDLQAGLALIAMDLAEDSPVPAAPPTPLDVSQIQAADDGSDAFCWGMAYVLEGSRLGGQVLHRRLKESLAPHPLRYLAERGGPAWPETMKRLRHELAGDTALAAGCRGAELAFGLLLTRFQHTGSLV